MIEPCDALAASRRDRQRICCQRKQILGEVGIKEEQSLTRDAECQLHARKDNQPFVRCELIAAWTALVGCRAPNIRDEGHLMMVGKGNGVQTS